MNVLAPAVVNALAADNPRPVVPPITTITLPESANMCAGLSADFGFGFGGKSCAQITFASGTSDCDDHLAFVLRAFGNFQRSDNIRAGRNTNEQALLLAKA